MIAETIPAEVLAPILAPFASSTKKSGQPLGAPQCDLTQKKKANENVSLCSLVDDATKT